MTDAAQIMKPGNEKLLSDIDYDAVYRIIDRERIRSRTWLKNALFAPKVIHNWRAYPIVDQETEASYKRKEQELQEKLERAQKNGMAPVVKKVLRKTKKAVKKFLAKTGYNKNA